MVRPKSSITKPWIVCQIGAREHYAIPRALHRAGRLGLALTDFWLAPGSLERLVLPTGKIFRRWHPELADAPVHAPNWRTLAGRCRDSLQALPRRPSFASSNTQFQRFCVDFLDSCVEGEGVENVTLFSFSYAARDLFRYAKTRGWRTVLGQIDLGAFEQSLVAAEHARYPTCGSSHQFGEVAYWESWKEEIQLADRIIVNSPWAVEGLRQENIDHSKIDIIPLVHAGEDLPEKRPGIFDWGKKQEGIPSDAHSQALRVLFLGNICLRKGVGRLIEAMRLLRDLPITLDLYGHLELDPAFWADLPKVRFHPPVKNCEVRPIFQAADVFILPSISDGFALTQLEALAAGTPVIASRQCGEVVIDGVNGILLQENSPGEIAALLKRLADNRETLNNLDPRILPDSLPRSLDDLASRLLGVPIGDWANGQQSVVSDGTAVHKPQALNPSSRTAGLKVAVMLGFLGLMLYFTLRVDSSFGSIEWMPRWVSKFLEKYIYLRNFWGFLPVGLFIGWAYRIGPVPWKVGKVPEGQPPVVAQGAMPASQDPRESSQAGVEKGRGSAARVESGPMKQVRWVVVGLLLLPVVKELIQIPLPHRHCNPVGMLAGFVGMALGLGIGRGIGHAIGLLGERRKKKTA